MQRAASRSSRPGPPEGASAGVTLRRYSRRVPAESRESIWRPPFAVDPWLTIAPLRHGRGDPTIRFERDGIWRAQRTLAGPATLHLRFVGGDIIAQAWGPGAELAIAGIPRLLGVDDDPAAFSPPRGPLRELTARHHGLRFTRSDWILGSLLPAIIEQKVTGYEAGRSYRALVRGHGEPAPGPGGLLLPPDPAALARLPYWAYHPLGLEQRRADTIRRVGLRAGWLEASLVGTPEPVMARLLQVPGIGPWTAAETVRTAMGDPDMVSVGDFHLPNLVAWMLAGEPRGDDARMLELLAPFAGQRARVVRLLKLSGMHAPRYGPRYAGRSIDSL
jgi:3-methyladenine DNA glycosylase/8-oxoguanine DNA glycosylase